MNDYKESILKELVEKYRNSKKDRGENKINRATKIAPQKLYKKYNANDGDLAEIEALNQAAEDCRKLGFVVYDKSKFSYEIKEIRLIDTKINSIEAYLKLNYNFISKQDKINSVSDLLEKYKGSTYIVNEICQKLHKKIEQNQIPKNYLEIEDLLKAVHFIENNEQELYLREASMLIYGSSKYLEENMLHVISKTFRHYCNTPCLEHEMEDEILNQYHIRKEPQRICIKGNCFIQTSGGTIDVSLFKNGIEFSSDELENILAVELNCDRFLTIENKAAYHRYHALDTVVFYLGGYMTRFQRDFLCLIYHHNENVHYEHFGDIDAGGFFIFEQLCVMTKIKFTPYYMGVAQLCDGRFKDCLQKLTDHDILRLKSLYENHLFEEETAYMLKHNVKLEQEIICYHLMNENSSNEYHL